MEQIKTYIVFELSGHQFFGIPGKTVEVGKIDAADGATIELEKVLFRKTESGAVEVGTPFLSTKATATIVKQIKGPKLIAFRFKRRQKVRVKRGHRQLATVIRVETI